MYDDLLTLLVLLQIDTDDDVVAVEALDSDNTEQREVVGLTPILPSGGRRFSTGKCTTFLLVPLLLFLSVLLLFLLSAEGAL